MSCVGCGGYRHDLPLADSNLKMVATRLAQVAHCRHEADKCLACQARIWRTQVTAAPGESLLWWDAAANDWLAWIPVEGIPEGVTLPLGLRYSTSSDEAELSVRVLMGSNPLPLRITEDGRLGVTDVPSLARDLEGGCFKLWLPCFDCGGAMITLATGCNESLLVATQEALVCFGWVESDGCPGCRHINCFAAGPDFKKNVILDDKREQIDVAATIAQLLGFTIPGSKGQVLTELFETQSAPEAKAPEPAEVKSK